MSLEHRYEMIVADLLSLLQSALLRFLSQKQIDVEKFDSYLIKFAKSMSEMEEMFVEGRTKFSKCVSELIQKAQQIDNRQQHLHSASNQKRSTANAPISKPMIRYKSNPKYSEAPQLSLNAIQQQQQFPTYVTPHKRSGTSEGHRAASTAPQQTRPQTSTQPNLNRTQFYYLNKQQMSKTIAMGETQREVKRKSFYDQLEKEKGGIDWSSIRFEMMERKKKDCGRKWMKISKLL